MSYQALAEEVAELLKASREFQTKGRQLLDALGYSRTDAVVFETSTPNERLVCKVATVLDAVEDAINLGQKQ